MNKKGRENLKRIRRRKTETANNSRKTKETPDAPKQKPTVKDHSKTFRSR